MNRPPTIRILLPCPPRTSERAWGDYYFGHSLGKCLEALGCKVRYSYAPATKNRRSRRQLIIRELKRRILSPFEIELVLRGQKMHPRLPWKRAVMWLISSPDSLTPKELASYRHVFVASKAFYDKISRDCCSSSVLLQCTDAELFTTGPEEPGSNVLFVGNRREYAQRPVLQAAIKAGYPVEVWGRGWEGKLPEGLYAGLHIPNDSLARHYRAAAVVLNDHTDDMRRHGFLSNRVYDVLACGRPIVTEEMPHMPQDILPALDRYRDEDEVAAATESALKRGTDDRAALFSMAEHVRRHHSFEARAGVILDTLLHLGKDKSPLRRRRINA